MTLSLKDLKRNSKSQLDKLNKEIEKINQPSYNTDNDKYWSCQTDKAGNGFAIIRFLPEAPQDGESGMPFIRLWTHGFKGPGGWYIENSLTTLGKDDPVGKWNTDLWNQGENSAGRKRVSGTGRDNPGTKRQLSYHSNIYVIKDQANPENEGKVFLFRYGKKIFDKINDAMHPQFEGEVAINPFDFWEGANFKLKIRQFEGYANYDKSEFDSPSQLFDDEDEIEAVWKKQYSLAELIAPDKFKTYEELEAKLHKVIGTASPSRETREPLKEEAAPEYRKKEAAAPDADLPWNEDEKVASKSVADDDDELAFFKNLIND